MSVEVKVVANFQIKRSGAMSTNVTVKHANEKGKIMMNIGGGPVIMTYDEAETLEALLRKYRLGFDFLPPAVVPDDTYEAFPDSPRGEYPLPFVIPL